MSLSVDDIFRLGREGKLRAGALIPSHSQKPTFDTHNPYDNSVIGQVERCNEDCVNEAVRAARATFDGGGWSRLAPASRKAVLLKWVGLLHEHADELAALDCLDAGKPISECLNTDIPETLHTLAWYAEAIDKLFGAVAPSPDNSLALVVKEPVGVVGVVLPWNFPAQMFSWKVGPALAAGNSVIVKPAELTSLSAFRMVQLAHEAGVPAGALTLVTGFGEETGRPLGLHPDVDVVSFTGSTEVGRLFLQYSAQSNLKGIVLECGGKSPQIIFEDAYPLAEVSNDLLSAAFWNMGENCSCGSRLLVHRSRKKELIDLLISHLPEWIIGDPRDPATKIGPMVEKAHHQKVLGYLEMAKSEGARLVYGGGSPALGAGWFIEPTIFDEVTSSMRLFQDEVFGPLLAITCFDTEAEAIQLANATQYGLAASLYTADVRRAHRVSKALRAGTVSVNCFSEGSIATPFGGYKTSGFGGRDKGVEAFDQYLETKTIWYSN